MEKFTSIILSISCFFILLVKDGISQTETGSGKFNKKSISVIPVTTASFSQYHDQMIKGLVYMEKTAQYDYNYVSTDAIIRFQNLFVQSPFNYNKLDAPENVPLLTNLLKETGILNEIVRTAVNYDTVLVRYENSLKYIDPNATSFDPLPDDADKGATLIVSNTYIGIPIYTGYDAEAKGKLIWLKFAKPTSTDWNKKPGKKFDQRINREVVYSDWSIDVDKIILQRVGVEDVSIKPSSDLLGLSTKEKMNLDMEKSLLPQEAGARTITRSIISFAEQLADFKQRGTLQEFKNGGGSLGIDLGNKDGIHLDQGFKIYSREADASGKEKYVYKGFVRINKVADTKKDRSALSDYYSIIPGGFEEGYSAEAHPQFMDITVRGVYKNVFIPKEMFSNFILPGNIFEKDVNTVFAAELSASYNLAKLVNITQLYFGASGSYGLPLVSNIASLSVTPTIIDAEIFLQKKFWFQRFNFSITAAGGFSTFSLKVGDTKISTDGLNYSVGGRASLEFAASPDLNIGLDAGYKYVLRPTVFKIDDYTFATDLFPKWKANEMRLGGINLSLKVSYSIPKL